MLNEAVKDGEPSAQPSRVEQPEPRMKKTAILLIGSESDSDEETLADNSVDRYSVELCASFSVNKLVLSNWWEREK